MGTFATAKSNIPTTLMAATTATEPSAGTIEAIKQKAKRLSILSMMSGGRNVFLRDDV
jgi:hypothetical protein